MKKFNVGDRVKGIINYGDDDTYTGTIIHISKNGKHISVLRDDGEEGSGVLYNNKHTWICDKKTDGTFGGSADEGTLTLMEITDWRGEFK